MSLDQGELSLSSDAASTLLFSGGTGGGSVLEEVVIEMDRLSMEETRDLLVSVLFVLKHLDTRECSFVELGVVSATFSHSRVL